MFLHKKYEGHNKYFIYLFSKFQEKKIKVIPWKSLLTPFLNVSIFDDRSLLSEFNSMSELNAEARSHIAKTLRRRLEGPQAEMFRLVEILMKESAYKLYSK